MTLTPSFIIKTVSISLAIVIFGGYGMYQARNMLRGPQVVIDAPLNGAHFTDPLITISGVAHNIASISLNDRPIFVDQKGVFAEKLLLPAGYTIMKMHAQDKFGRETEQLLEFTYTPPVPTLTLKSATSTNTSSFVSLLTE